jgi:hypothetical protein
MIPAIIPQLILVGGVIWFALAWLGERGAANGRAGERHNRNIGG